MNIVFIVNVIRQARCIRRIEDFKQNNYNTIVYGFDRENDNRKLPTFDYTIIGNIKRTMSYISRLRIMIRSIRKINNNDNNIYYLFNFDVALAFYLANLFHRKKYIYEVSDLMEFEVGNQLLTKILLYINKKLIESSIETVMTSEGFVKPFYGDKKPLNITILQNKLNKKCAELSRLNNKIFDKSNIIIGFTGAIRNEAISRFIDIVGKEFKNIQVHFYGVFSNDKVYSKKIKESIDKYDNIKYYGTFRNPDDLPLIYSNIDLVLCLYTSKGNDKYLEPNKFFEAIYFEKPIIVSRNTYIGEKVQKLGVGYTINENDEEEIKRFLKTINIDEYNIYKNNCSKIDKKQSLDDSSGLFYKLKKYNI